MHRVITNGMDMRNFPKHFLCNWRCCDIVRDENAPCCVPFMKGRLELEEIGMVGD